KSALPGVRKLVTPDRLVLLMLLFRPGVYCGWLKPLKKSARRFSFVRSWKANFLYRLKSKLLMPRLARTLRPEFASVPAWARINCALGSLARYPTVPPAEFRKTVTSLLRPGVPFGLTMARSVAASRFRLASKPLCGV